MDANSNDPIDPLILRQITYFGVKIYFLHHSAGTSGKTAQCSGFFWTSKMPIAYISSDTDARLPVC